ncbi:flavin-containing monooxygenase [Sandaracinobacteroides saxicola]|uniref:Trimethylamine monooxygenase n=1 Tax=Sandaracinobacteroides saxicola TaxID=2759707 RepID=A0A7G5IFL2_9SPHN|nr:NAD(P)-binding domain-containing protein [Sandaracinobacteroides saxicola]QMW22154.1 NAD(P)-binding domain-containing protein [Sandaracinobacteroides saxicola]
MTRVLIIGAGCSGFTTAKRLKDAGVAFDWFEMSDRIGGNWAYGNPNGRSAAYQSLHIDTSKWRLAFEDFPVPANWPDFPHHSLINDYFNAYVNHFGLRPLIHFNHEVQSVRQHEDATWHATVNGDARGPYSHVAVANGHHWCPNIPDIPGHFDGIEMHARDYRTPFEPVNMVGKRIVVVGLGNTAVDIASELGQRTIAARLWVRARRGVWVLPKYRNGQPMDKTILPGWFPLGLKRRLGAAAVKKMVGRMEDFGLPTPDHEPLEAHPTVSSEFLARLGSGDIAVKPMVSEKVGSELVFADGSRETVDVLIHATGYRLSFPFLDARDVALKDNHLPLFKRMVQAEPRLHGLWFMGLAQPLPTLVNFAEQQSKLFVAHLTGAYTLPSPSDMARIIAADEAAHKGHYYSSPRHTIQVDFDRYCHDLRAEMTRGAKRKVAA